MRTGSLIFLFIIFVYSCKPAKVVSVANSGTDTVKFTYLYSEALKNKMLGQTQIAHEQFVQCLKLNPSSSATSYQLAQLAIEKGDFLLAKEYSEFCINKVSSNEWYLLQRAEIAKKLSEAEVYSKIYDKLVDLFPDNLTYLYENTIIEYKSKKYDDALESLKKLEAEIGINEDISFLRNNINFELKRFNAIQLELQKLSKYFPDSTKYADMLAEFYLSSSQVDKAMEVYKSILDLDTDNCSAELGIAWIYGNTSNFERGYPFLIKGIKNESCPFSKKNKVAELYLNVQKSRLNIDSINVIYLILLGLNSPNIEIINKYLVYLYDYKKYDEVEKYAKIAVTASPENFNGWDYLLNTLMIEGKNSELQQYSLKAQEYFPNHALVFFFNGYSQFLLNKFNEAINYFEIGLDFVSDNQSLEKQFLVYLAESYHKIGKYKQSDLYFDKYLKTDSTNTLLMNNYAYYLSQRNVNLGKALTLSKKCIESDPFNSTFLDTYAWILFWMNEYDKSANYIERAYKYGGNLNPVVIEHYGDILFKKNKVDEALERWKEAYSLNRKNSKLLEKINKIELEN